MALQLISIIGCFWCENLRTLFFQFDAWWVGRDFVCSLDVFFLFKLSLILVFQAGVAASARTAFLSHGIKCTYH